MRKIGSVTYMMKRHRDVYAVGTREARTPNATPWPGSPFSRTSFVCVNNISGRAMRTAYGGIFCVAV